MVGSVMGHLHFGFAAKFMGCMIIAPGMATIFLLFWERPARKWLARRLTCRVANLESPMSASK
jgi:peptidoglycan/LPS O-acetylase OafA/YrhL